MSNKNSDPDPTLRKTFPSIDRRSFLRWSALIAPSVLSSHRVSGSIPWHHEHQFGMWNLHAAFPLPDADHYQSQFQQLEKQIRLALELGALRHKTDVMLLADERQYRQYLQTYFPGAPFRPALFIKTDRTSMVFAFRSKNMWTDLRHEATHAVLHATHPFVPLWLDEGLAEYFELTRSIRLVAKDRWPTIKKDLDKNRILPLTELELFANLSEMDEREYLYSWAWVCFLLHHSSQSRSHLVHYLRLWQAGRVPVPLSESGSPLTDLEQFGRFWRDRGNHLN